jgi:hypothetical protein
MVFLTTKKEEVNKMKKREHKYEVRAIEDVLREAQPKRIIMAAFQPGYTAGGEAVYDLMRTVVGEAENLRAELTILPLAEFDTMHNKPDLFPDLDVKVPDEQVIEYLKKFDMGIVARGACECCEEYAVLKALDHFAEGVGELHLALPKKMVKDGMIEAPYNLVEKFAARYDMTDLFVMY